MCLQNISSTCNFILITLLNTKFLIDPSCFFRNNNQYEFFFKMYLNMFDLAKIDYLYFTMPIYHVEQFSINVKSCFNNYIFIELLLFTI